MSRHWYQTLTATTCLSKVPPPQSASCQTHSDHWLWWVCPESGYQPDTPDCLLSTFPGRPAVLQRERTHIHSRWVWQGWFSPATGDLHERVRDEGRPKKNTTRQKWLVCNSIPRKKEGWVTGRKLSQTHDMFDSDTHYTATTVHVNGEAF